MAWCRLHCASPATLVLLQHRRAPSLSVRCFLYFFLCTGDGEWCWKEHSAGEVLHTETKLLDTYLEQLSSKASLRAASIAKLVMIWHFSLT